MVRKLWDNNEIVKIVKTPRIEPWTMGYLKAMTAIHSWGFSPNETHFP